VLFNSYIFIWVFLPLTLAGFYACARGGGAPLAKLWLVVASLLYYGWWNPSYLTLILGSMLGNFAIGSLLANERLPRERRRTLLWLGVIANLALLGWYKYANFTVNTANAWFDLEWKLAPIVLPLAISFFTFTQIAYLVDAWNGRCHENRFIDYALFVLFFPHLIAGPVIHHGEVMPQFARRETYRFHARNLAIGFTIFALGLAKKTLIADPLGAEASKVFAAAAGNTPLHTGDAWLGCLAYTFQLYFDFSGYSDMAVGASRLFGVRMPVNFNSPYKAIDLIDFWRRWHITLSRFLRDYLYVPLGGNRKGPTRQAVNLFLTMLLGGIWHGAGWNFVAWGAVHGGLLVVNHLLTGGRKRGPRSMAAQWSGRLLTFAVVSLAWVLFRAKDLGTAVDIYAAMFGLGDVAPAGALLRDKWWGWLAVALVVVWFAPNTQEIMCRFRPVLEKVAPPDLPETLRVVLWRPTPLYAVLIALLFTACVLSLSRHSEFLYYQF
jgi:D-alanyl-lipoteichoic acid acyltransferase DltB (MBOAT superfamily)